MKDSSTQMMKRGEMTCGTAHIINPHRMKMLCYLAEGQQVSRTMREISVRGLVQYLRREGRWSLKDVILSQFTIVDSFIILID